MEKQSKLSFSVLLALASLSMSACQGGGTMTPSAAMDMSDTSKLVRLEAVLYAGMPNPAAYIDDTGIAIIGDMIMQEPAAPPTATIPDRLGYNGFALVDMYKVRIGGNDHVRIYNQIVVAQSGDQVKKFTDTGRILEKKLFEIIKPNLSADDVTYIGAELMK
ncbi:MAG TPA: hypothetical protein PKI03_18450 [Pseudomonadota bacterium]|nr:hypothetical protein [Pseudomonadota bacterium]